MGDRSAIAWTDATWNPFVGCSRVSEGCRNCYAERLVHRGLSPQHRGLTKLVGGEPRWTGEVRLVESALTLPLRWRKPRRIFVNSLSDLFHESVPDAWIERIFDVMLEADQHTYQVLTKRPERMRDWVTRFLHPGLLPTILEHIWLGVSVENQETADARIPLLLQTPAAVRFVSCEPLLGSVHLTPYLGGHDATEECRGSDLSLRAGRRAGGASSGRLNWVIAGGESGPGARPCDLAWIRSLVAQCRAAGVPVFVKQLGASAKVQTGLDRKTDYPPVGTVWTLSDPPDVATLRLKDRKGADPTEWPADLRVQQWPR